MSASANASHNSGGSANNNNNNAGRVNNIIETELKYNMLFNVLSILTNTFQNSFTIFNFLCLQIRIVVQRESVYETGMTGVTHTRNDQELFINSVSTWRFLNYTVIVTFLNTTIPDEYHTNGTFPPRSIRPTYVNIHPPGVFLNAITGAQFSFLYFMTNAFTIGETMFQLGPFAVVMNVTTRAVIHTGLTTTTRLQYTYATLSRFVLRVQMMEFNVEFNAVNHGISTIYEICPARPFEDSPRPPINLTCFICRDRRSDCTILPCKHFICHQCSLLNRFFGTIHCGLCRGRMQCVIHYDY